MREVDESGKLTRVWLLLAIISMVIALLAALGVLFADDTNGRIIYGILWTAIGLSWLGRYFVARKQTGSSDGSGGSGSG